MELEMFSMHRAWWPDLVGYSKDMNQNAIYSTIPKFQIKGLPCEVESVTNIMYASHAYF